MRTYYDETRDLVQFLNVFDEAILGNNNPFNFYRTYLIPNTNDNTVSNLLNNAVIIHYCSDDTCPMHFNGSYMGANHGCSDMKKIVSINHDKSTEDVGSEWIDSDGHKWYLLRIVDSAILWMISENIGVGDEWNFHTNINGNLTHSQNATHTTPINIGSYTYGQLEPAINNQIKRVFLENGDEVVDDGLYYSNNVTITNNYKIIDPASVIDYVVSQVGSSIQPDLNNGDANVTLNISYNFDKYGGCLINYNTTCNKLIDIGILSGLQSGILNKDNYSNIYVYMPNTIPISDGVNDWDLTTLRDFSIAPSTTLSFTNSYWENNDLPPYRVIEYLGEDEQNLDVAFIECFSLSNGITALGNRNSLVNYPMVLASTRKMYPRAIDSAAGDLPEGTYTEVVGYRGYVNPKRYSNSASSVFFYKENEDIILIVDYHESVENDTINLPAELDSMYVTVLDKHDSLTLGSNIIQNSSINANVLGNYGYGVFKLSHIESIATIENVIITGDRFSVNLSWEYSVSNSVYNIYRSLTPEGEYFLIGITTNFYFTDTDISLSNKYFYKITAEDSLK